MFIRFLNVAKDYILFQIQKTMVITISVQGMLQLFPYRKICRIMLYYLLKNEIRDHSKDTFKYECFCFGGDTFSIRRTRNQSKKGQMWLENSLDFVA